LKKKKYKIKTLNEQLFLRLFTDLSEHKIKKEAVYQLMKVYLKNGNLGDIDYILPSPIEDIIQRYNMALIQLNHIKVINPDKKKEILTGIMMDDLRGRVDGYDIIQYINTNFDQRRN